MFYLKRNDPVPVFATLLKTSEYSNPDVKDAMSEELSKWLKYGAYEEVDDKGQEKITTQWVVNPKEKHDGLKVDIKARLCLRGFQEEDKPRSDSPTVER